MKSPGAMMMTDLKHPATDGLSDRSEMYSLIRNLVDLGEGFRQRYFWHASGDRYILFLAEFFLRRTNRTTVDRNLPRFLERFPEADDLIHARQAEVAATARWAGLRSRTMRLPETMGLFMTRTHWTADELMTLPYIGEYAAQAIALYVFGQPTFPIDNNVKRVLMRYFECTDEIQLPALASAVQEQALDFGGVCCLQLAHMGLLALGWDNCRKSAKCQSCPLRNDCRHQLQHRVHREEGRHA